MSEAAQIVVNRPDKCPYCEADGRFLGAGWYCFECCHIEPIATNDDRWYSAGVTDAIAKERDNLRVDNDRLRALLARGAELMPVSTGDCLFEFHRGRMDWLDKVRGELVQQ